MVVESIYPKRFPRVRGPRDRRSPGMGTLLHQVMGTRDYIGFVDKIIGGVPQCLPLERHSARLEHPSSPLRASASGMARRRVLTDLRFTIHQGDYIGIVGLTAA